MPNTNYLTEPKCSHCGEILAEDVSIDHTLRVENDSAYMLRFVEGYCPICNRIYTWTEKYKYENACDLQESEE